MIDNLSIAFHDFVRRMLTSFSVDEILQPKHVNRFTNFTDLPLRLDMASFGSKHIYSVLFAFM